MKGKSVAVFSWFRRMIDAHFSFRAGKSRRFAFVQYKHLEKVQRILIRMEVLLVNGGRVVVVVANQHQGSFQVRTTMRHFWYVPTCQRRSRMSYKDAVNANPVQG